MGQGTLTPPGAPAATMKTLDQLDAKLEKRTPISSLPFTISASGSYYLTANLTQVGTGAGITISADNVTVDLGGFTLSGTLSGTAAGISVPATHKNLQVSNGTIRNWNGGGIAASSITNSIYRGLRLADNFDNGLFAGAGALIVDCAADNNIIGLNVGAGSTVRSCTLSNNLSTGIATAAGCTVTGCTVRSNNGGGILTLTDSTVTGCTAKGDFAGDGIDVGTHSLVKDCVAAENTGNGIVVAGDRSIVDGCIADSNGAMGIVSSGNGTGTVIRNCGTSDNVGDGINVYRQCLVTGNISSGNGSGAPSAAGIHATSFSNRIEGNMVINNDRGIHLNVDATNCLVIRNTATGNTTQFDIIANNKVALIVTPPNSGAISGSSGGAGFGSTDPYVNVSY